ncbi:DVU0259 family response regulator domain-containing protein [Desulfohalobium retbaense]|uniref:Response regulator receiver protein n=1 Tax=Desulfohalobium retbaense (strain ATCC 49708 / DSM 5692 / JCM 16813 / HR100) TaxID=485915 RepID=C8X163_DESRD|nr:response regulator [Desulfohalobium retbaense]ACV68160.1 response regulator receiver protein [Desulfohalobium retbaense DSM 5692]
MAYKIMVIDDDPDIVDYLVSIFEDNDYETCKAYDGHDALEIARSERPDLITLDLEMPKEWGPRFYRHMSKDPVLQNTPVLVISGLSGIHLAIKKAVATINKPFDPDKVLDIVRTTLSEG